MKIIIFLGLISYSLCSLGVSFSNTFILEEDMNQIENNYYNRTTIKDSTISGTGKSDFLNSYLLESYISNYKADTLTFKGTALHFFNMNDVTIRTSDFHNTYWNYGKLENARVENFTFNSSHLRAIYIKNIISRSFSLTRSSLYLTDLRSSSNERFTLQDVKINKSKLIDLTMNSGKIHKGAMLGGKWNISTFLNISLSHFKFVDMQFKSNRFDSKSSLMHVTFKNTNLESTEFKDTKLENVTIENSNVLDLKFINCELINVNFVGVDIKQIKFTKSKFTNVKVNGVSFKE